MTFILYLSVSDGRHYCGKGALRGRPCGGLPMFIRSSMCIMDCIVKSDRVMAVKVHNCIFISVYFPVFRSSPEYESEINSIVGVIDTIVADNAQLPIIIGGDFNSEFHDGSTRCYAVNKLSKAATKLVPKLRKFSYSYKKKDIETIEKVQKRVQLISW